MSICVRHLSLIGKSRGFLIVVAVGCGFGISGISADAFAQNGTFSRVPNAKFVPASQVTTTLPPSTLAPVPASPSTAAPAKPQTKTLRQDVAQPARNSVSQSGRNPVLQAARNSAVPPGRQPLRKIASTNSPAAEPALTDPKAELKLGLQLMQQKRYDEALVHLRKANEEPNPDSLQALATLYEIKKDNLQVIRALEDLVMLKPTDFRAFRELGDAYVATNKFDKAIENYRKSFTLNPKYRQAYTGLISVLQQRKNIFEIRNVLSTMYEHFANDPSVLADLCHYYAVDSLFDKGLEYCKLAVKADPKNPDNRIYYGLLENGKYGNRKGTPRITETAKKFPTSAFAQISAARVTSDDKLWEAASRYYRRATALNPKDGDAWLGAAGAEFNAGNYAEALNLYLQACRFSHRAYNELTHSTGILGVQKQEKWYRQYRDSQDKCSVSKTNSPI